MPDENQKPVKEFRAFNVKAAIWEKDKTSKNGKPYKEYSVMITKSYKNENGDWCETKHFFESDLPRLILVAQKAHEYILLGDVQ